MAFQQSDLDALDAAIAGGILRVKYSDKEVEYRSLEEMLQVRAMMKKELGVTGANGKKSYPTFSKGIC